MDGLIAPIEVSRAVLEEFRVGFRAHAAMAAVRQERINQSIARLETASKLVDGIGQLEYQIDADLYWHMRALHGPDCWRDEAFLKDCEAKGLIKKVKGISDRVAVRFDGVANLELGMRNAECRAAGTAGNSELQIPNSKFSGGLA